MSVNNSSAELFTLVKSAREWGVSDKTARQIIRDNQIPAVLVGKRRRYPADIVRQFTERYIPQKPD